MKMTSVRKAFYRVKFEGDDAPFPFSVRSAGHYWLKNGNDEYKMPRKFIQFFWTISGEGIVKIQKKEYILRANQVFYYLSDEKHIIRVTDEQLEYRWFTFDGPVATAIMHGFNYPQKPFHAGKCPHELFETLEKRIKNSTIAEMRNLTTVAWQILAVAGTGQNVSSGEDRILKLFFQIIHKNYSNPNLDINSISKYLKVHRSTLTRIINGQTGMSPKKYLYDFRLQQALSMLRSSTLQINEVSEKCGFSNCCYFSRVIKQAVNLSPVKYRNQYTSL